MGSATDGILYVFRFIHSLCVIHAVPNFCADLPNKDKGTDSRLQICIS